MWAKDDALPLEEGGSAPAITTTLMSDSAEGLRRGSSVIGLAALGSISTELSHGAAGLCEERIVKLADKVFAKPGPAGGLVPYFPDDWPLAIPCIMRDAAFPQRWRHAMGDELVLAFWKAVDTTHSFAIAHDAEPPLLCGFWKAVAPSGRRAGAH